MELEDQLRTGSYLMLSTVLASLALFLFGFLCVYFGHKHFIFIISNFIFGVNVWFGQQIYVFKVKSYLGQ